MSVEDYKSGFRVNMVPDILSREWLLNEESTSTRLIFLGYDANLYPLPDLDDTDLFSFYQTIFVGLERTLGFLGKVQLDDIIIRDDKGTALYTVNKYLVRYNAMKRNGKSIKRWTHIYSPSENIINQHKDKIFYPYGIIENIESITYERTVGEYPEKSDE